MTDKQVPTRALAVAAMAALAGSGCLTDRMADPPDSGTTSPYPRTIVDRIIYARYDTQCPECPRSLWTAATDGSDPRLLLDSLQFPDQVSVSPDGRRVVFEDRGMLFTLDADGRHKHAIPGTLSLPVMPQWSPDGFWILFDATDRAVGTRQVYRVRPDGSDPERLTDPAFGPSAVPAWSPDGAAIVFMRQQPPDWLARRVVIMDLATRTERVVSDTTRPFGGWWPAWSPDGSALTFLDSDGPTSWTISRLDLATGRYSVLGSGGGNSPARWSPDGSLLLFGYDDLRVMRPDGSGSRILLSDERFYFYGANWSPRAIDALHFRF